MAFAKHLMFLSISAATCGLSINHASAQAGPNPPFTSYAAKFSCGLLAADSDVVKGTYATSINIHNPQATVPVTFAKKFVLANPEGQHPGAIVIHTDTLGPDIAERVDCPLIRQVLDTTASHIEGFIVLEVLPQGQFRPVLDVVGKYSARSTGATSSVTSFNVTRYEGKWITK